MKTLITLLFLFLSTTLGALPSEQSLVQSGDRSEIYHQLLEQNQIKGELQNDGHSPCRYAAATLTDTDLLKITQGDKLSLDETVNQVKKGIILDEKLRWSIWNALQTHHVIQLRHVESRSPLARADLDLAAAIDRSFSCYADLKASLNKKLTSLTASHPIIKALIGEDEKNTRFPKLAEQLENSYHLESYNKFHKACGTTARAIVEWMFSNKKLAAPAIQPQNPAHDWKGLIAAIRDPKLTQALFMIESDPIDHVFIIIKTGPNSFYLLQSYVANYSLSGFLASEGQLVKTEKQIIQLLKDLYKMHNDTSWNSTLTQLHEKDFLIPPPDHIVNGFPKSSRLLSYYIALLSPSSVL